MAQILSGDSACWYAPALTPSGICLRTDTVSDPGGADSYPCSYGYSCSDSYPCSYPRRGFAYSGAHGHDCSNPISWCERWRRRRRGLCIRIFARSGSFGAPACAVPEKIAFFLSHQSPAFRKNVSLEKGEQKYVAFPSGMWEYFAVPYPRFF